LKTQEKMERSWRAAAAQCSKGNSVIDFDVLNRVNVRQASGLLRTKQTTGVLAVNDCRVLNFYRQLTQTEVRIG
jgi:hypothetical protein